ncbi:hypothetical protein G9P44_004400 [Scheffersomyces stipitis]|nr:hypothetical protein G9P44_004400 [Scheffersomyces stipitis]
MEDRKKFNLKLSSLSLRRKSKSSASANDIANEDGNDSELVNILPSYQMYRSTISKQLIPSREDLRTQPPSYELSPISSASSYNEYGGFDGIPSTYSLPTSPVRELFANPLDLEGESNETILENAHKLKRISASNKEISKALHIHIFMTETVGKVGVKPKIIDPLSIEIKQGDYLYGFVLVTNKTKYDVPFDMFSTVLEGCATFGSNGNLQSSVVRPPTTVVRFLTMFDFNASWNDAALDRLVSDNNNPMVPTIIIDPIDGTHVQLDPRKILEPNITYKKFFAFKVPEKLLDVTCEHGFVKHLQIPPTLGISKNEVITSLRQKYKESDLESSLSEEDAHRGKCYASLTNDMFFSSASIDFSVSARIIGRASDYESIFVKSLGKQGDDEYVVANEDYCYLRVIPVTTNSFELNRSMINEEAKLLSASMEQNIKEKISLARELSAIPVDERSNTTSPDNQLHPTDSAADVAKMQQSYYSKVRARHVHRSRDDLYEVLFPFKRRNVFGTSKVLGMCGLTTPKSEYHVDYHPLPRYLRGKAPPTTTVSIPMELTFLPAENGSRDLPGFKRISVELIALTVKSKKLPIPLVIHPEMMFENKGKSVDNFDTVTLRTYQKYALELSKLIKDVGVESLNLEKQMLRDLKCMANLSTKYDHFKIDKMKLQSDVSSTPVQLLSSIPWEQEAVAGAGSTAPHDEVKFTKKFNINIDLSSAIHLPSMSSDFCLVPDFQTCYVARLYYLNIGLRTPNGEKFHVKVPLILQRQKQV